MKKIFLYVLFVGFTNTLISQNIDIDILKKINVDRDHKLDNTFILITQSMIPVSVATPMAVYGIGLIKHDSTLKNKGAFITASLLVSAGITFGLKYAVHRPRPFVTYPFIEKKTKAGNLSFPSGHASDAFATATSLSIAFPKWYVIAPSFLWASAVGYSRMDLGVHYPSDVLGGAIIGVGSTYFCYKANQWLSKRNHSK